MGTSERIPADQALASGLIDEVFYASTYNEQTDIALRFLNPFLKQPYKLAVQEIKGILASYDNQNEDNDELMRKEKAAFERLWLCPDNQQTVKDFFAKLESKTS